MARKLECVYEVRLQAQSLNISENIHKHPFSFYRIESAQPKYVPRLTFKSFKTLHKKSAGLIIPDLEMGI